jgi:hypothetical protein
MKVVVVVVVGNVFSFIGLHIVAQLESEILNIARDGIRRRCRGSLKLCIFHLDRIFLIAFTF